LINFHFSGVFWINDEDDDDVDECDVEDDEQK